jgi:hypothetical protein
VVCSRFPVDLLEGLWRTWPWSDKIVRGRGSENNKFRLGTPFNLDIGQIFTGLQTPHQDLNPGRMMDRYFLDHPSYTMCITCVFSLPGC